MTKSQTRKGLCSRQKEKLTWKRRMPEVQTRKQIRAANL